MNVKQRATRLTVVSCASGAWGAEKSLSLITRSLMQDHGYDVKLVCHSDATAAFWRKRAGSAVEVIPQQHGRFATVSAFARFLLRNRRGAQRSDVVLIASLDLVPLVGLRILLPRTTFIIDLHDCPRHILTRVITGLAALCSHRVVAVSEFIASYVSRSRVQVIGRPIESPARPARRGTAGARLRVGVIGRIDPLKQIEVVVNACRVAAHAPTLVVRGATYASEDGYADALLSYASDRLGDRFTYDGVVPIGELYDEIDVVVLANHLEPSGTTVGEARAAGVFVVVPDRGGALEWVDDNRNGFVFEAGSAHSLAHVLDRCANEQAFRSTVEQDSMVEVLVSNGVANIGERYHRAVVTAVRGFSEGDGKQC